ncbi:hypothetical protein NEMBOFW57_005770 [Staphylotrichum longicolle]|uniref:Methyltransferase domain-containing protein n=1 Tax=Staphylotrichum longicolle TaxID=669026 RepID=A0AAD4HWA6_9PEZI|nr:hypothetical protein NEMBOFW57_005770 [Staphylotrichum longicolle]
MEFLSGYAAAKTPYLTYEVEGSSRSRSKPARTNSTAGTSKKKRSRIPGHARTNSASTSSTGSGGRSDPHQAQAHQAAHAPPHSPAWAHQGGGADASGAGVDPATGAPLTLTSSAGDGTDSAAEQHHHHYTTRRSSQRERDRMPSSLKYFQDKQLPATPRLNTQDIGGSSKHPGAGTSSDPASARTPASASALSAAAFGGNPGAVVAAVSFPDRRAPQSSAMFPYPDMSSGKASGGAGVRAESISSVSGATTTSNRTMHSGEQASDSAFQLRPFVIRNGRTYLADPTLPYPLPVDLEEIHRQSLKTMLLMQLYGRPICAPAFANKPPPRILEVGCGTGFWSTMCYRYYEARGLHKDISFTGIDIVPLPPNVSSSSSSSSGDVSADTRPDKDMNWRFVQHDLRKLPLPFPAASFDLIMVKDMSLAASLAMQQGLIEEYIRILTPGGTLEIWETDHMLRMLRPHVPDCATTSGPAAGAAADDDASVSPTSAAPTTTHPDTDDNTATAPADKHQTELGGAYVMTANTPLSTPLNNFLVEYNSWVSRALEARTLCAMPCTAVGPLLIQEAEALMGVDSRRLAVPLSEIRWEREGVGGVVTKDGKSYIETTKARKGGAGPGGAVAGGGGGSGSGSGGTGGSSAGQKEGGSGGKGLDAGAAALRRTALLTVVQQIQSLEPMLRETAGKSQDEWDTWLGKMMNDLRKKWNGKKRVG